MQRTDWQLSEGRGLGGLGRKSEKIKKRKKTIDTDNSIVITRGEEALGR